MSGRLPGIFISSTCFDLKQVRADLATFIENDLGYRFLASEFSSFPVDPSVDVVENCRRQIAAEADILVLIVGGRYGSIVPSSGRSVTNVEYIAARSKPIPVFAFIDRDVLGVLPIWERNPDADFTSVVDSPKLLSFVSDLRSASGVWTFKFEFAQDIIETLRTQLAYAMTRGLNLSARARDDERALRTLSGAAFRLVAERPMGWEPLLLIQILEDEFSASADLRRDHELGIAIGQGERVVDEAMSGWAASAMSEARRMIEATEAIARASLNTALTNGAPEPIIYGARQIARVYREGLNFIARLRRADVPAEWEPIREELTHLLDDVFVEFDAFVARAKRQVEDAIASPVTGTIQVPMTLNFHIANTDKLIALAKSMRRRTRQNSEADEN